MCLKMSDVDKVSASFVPPSFCLEHPVPQKSHVIEGLYGSPRGLKYTYRSHIGTKIGTASF
jgi:hypothetical protein